MNSISPAAIIHLASGSLFPLPVINDAVDVFIFLICKDFLYCSEDARPQKAQFYVRAGNDLRA
jgi:hypothetical protein